MRGFGVGVENDPVLVLGSKLSWFSMGIEIALFFVRGSELTWFLYRGRNDLVLCLDPSCLSLCGGSNLTWF